MNTPKTHLRDYYAFEHDLNNLRRWRIKGRISQDQFNSIITDLQRDYQGLIFPEDVNLFDDIGGLLGFLIDSGLPVTQIEHEMLHGITAAKLGYTVKYGCRLLLTEDNQIGYIPFVKVLEDIAAEDFKKIVAAPRYLSKGDKDALTALK